MISRLLSFGRQMLSEQDGLASTKRVLFAAAILLPLALLAFDVLKHNGFRSESNAALLTLVGAASAAYGVSQFAK